MVDLLKKTLLTTIGIACLTQGKVKDIGKKYIEEANLSKEEGKKFYNDLIKKTEEARLSL